MRQCAKCPWKVSTNPHEIPNGYSVEQHRALAVTIAEPASLEGWGKPLRVMACHETHSLPCIGWLANQLGPGNNLALRLSAAHGHVDTDFELVGEQHACFEDTLPIELGKLGNPLLARWMSAPGGMAAGSGSVRETQTYVRWTLEEISARKAAVRKFAWAVPDVAVLDAIAEWGPVVEIGAGTGYWARLLLDRGVDVLAFDAHPPPDEKNTWHVDAALFCPVVKGGPEVAREHAERTLLLCWPPYADPFAAECLDNYEGLRVVFVGEDAGGCTGDARFFARLQERFELVQRINIPTWSGVYDEAFFYQRRSE